MTKANPKDHGIVQLSLKEHVLKRPDSYVGSVLPTETDVMILNKNKIENVTMNVSHALLKIFDEILVNTRDVKVRDEKGKKAVTEIKATFNKETGVFSVYNDGPGIPIEKHSNGKWIPYMIFGELITSKNFDDNEERITGGKNGLGSKVSNIFSAKFKIYLVNEGQSYEQTWYDNMERFDEPIIKKTKDKDGTLVEFLPDYPRFNMLLGDKKFFNEKFVGLIHRRTADMAACIGDNVSVYFNDEKINIHNLSDYAKLLINKQPFIALQKTRWNVVISRSRDDIFEHVSFVNGVYTMYGGTHVEYIANQIVEFVKTKLEKDPDLKGGKNIKVSDIKKYLLIFVAADIVNPNFDSQSKEILKTPPEKFGSTFVLSTATLNQIDAELQLVETIRNILLRKTLSDMTKGNNTKKGKITGIAKLEDANWAGTKNSHLCKLILTEGDSAAGMARSGLAVVGRDKFGIFPLRGKVLNVRAKSTKVVAANEEIQNIIKIMGLRMDLADKYDKDNNVQSLRYGGIVIMTDADYDGYHIAGLLINFLHAFFPSLLRIPNFIQNFMTPIGKVSKGKETIAFYSYQEMEEWFSKNNNGKGWETKFLKGLGSSDAKAAKEYFSAMDKHLLSYVLDDIEKTNEAIHLAFDKEDDSADARKDWLNEENNLVEKKETFDTSAGITYHNFIHKQLKQFSVADNVRSIPHVIDGLKVSQRKILYAMMKKNIRSDMKVAQLGGIISNEVAYHHGEMSMNSTIVGMAQDFTGSNNLNLLVPSGQFGCFKPETEIMMWDASIKQAQHISIGDKLVGDDGNVRTVISLVSGFDDMYLVKENESEESFTVNGLHILTMYFAKNNVICWKESRNSWYVEYFDGKKIRSQAVKVNQNISTNDHLNKSKITKEEGYFKIQEIQKNIQSKFNINPIIELTVIEYLNMSEYEKKQLRLFTNLESIKWEKKNVPIDPYILGCWLGDGDSAGKGFTSADIELVKHFAIWCKTINCEVSHHKSTNHDHYHYTIRRTNSGVLPALGSDESSSTTCIACSCSTAMVNVDICNWRINDEEKNYKFNQICDNELLELCKNKNYNPFTQILKKYNLLNNKHIPEMYIHNDVETRLQLLAGFIDTDGTLKHNNTSYPQFEISQSKRMHSELIYALEKLCKSLGFGTSIGLTQQGGVTKKCEDKTMIYLLIRGEISKIPTKLLRKQVVYSGHNIKLDTRFKSFTISHSGKGKYNGWTIDGNERFLLANNLVVHNCRMHNGNDSASPRYIFTRINDISDYIYNKYDLPLLDYLEDDGCTVEPITLIPIIPMILVNGSSGIGTGYSTSIPLHNPMEVIDNMLRIVNDEKPKTMLPWYKDYRGTININKGKFVSKGIVERTDKKTIYISELPVGMATQSYKDKLNSWIEVKDSVVRTYNEYHTDKHVGFEIECNEKYLDELFSKDDETLYKELGLCSSINVNMNAFNFDGIIETFNNPNEIMTAFKTVRLEYYQKRKNYLQLLYQRHILILENKLRYLKEVNDGTLEVFRKAKDFREAQLKKGKYACINMEIDLAKIKNISELTQNDPNASYNYLSSMTLDSLGLETQQRLETELDKYRQLLKDITKKTIQELWKDDLLELKEVYTKWYEEQCANYEGDDPRKKAIGISKKTKTSSKRK